MFFFLNKQYGFRFSSLTAEVLMVIAQRVCQTLDNIGKPRTVDMDILEARARVLHAIFRHKLKSNFISGIILYSIQSCPITK